MDIRISGFLDLGISGFRFFQYLRIWGLRDLGILGFKNSWSKLLGLPAMVGRLREMAAFTTDGWLQTWRGYMDLVLAKLILNLQINLERRESRSAAVVGA